MISGGTSAATVGNVSMGNVGWTRCNWRPTAPRLHGQLAKRSERQHVLVECADRAHGGQPAAQPGVCVAGGLDAGVRAGRQEASRQADAARGEAVAASTERSAVLSERSRGLAKLRHRAAAPAHVEQLRADGRDTERLDQMSKSVADSTGYRNLRLPASPFGAAGHLGLNTASCGAGLNATRRQELPVGLSARSRKVSAA
jgi:conjugal transfer mating pair stabilization protein TraG